MSEDETDEENISGKSFTYIITLIVGGLVYSIVSFAYMHQTFTSKDVIQIVLENQKNIEAKLDNFILKYGGN